MGATTAAVVTAVAAVGSAAYGVSANEKAKKAQKNAYNQAEKNGAFDPLALPKPQKLEVPSAESILGRWRGEVTGNYPAYDKISDNFNRSEQDAARYANQQANPRYYDVLNQITGNALSASRGELPADVKAEILRNASEDSYLRGFSYGTSGGGGNVFAGGNAADANLALRNLGLSSLDMMRYGDALGQDVLGQSRSSRGRIISAVDVSPTTQIFQDQMNADAVAKYNYAVDKAAYKAGTENAATYAAQNKLAFTTGAQAQRQQLDNSSAQLAFSALSALGGLGGNFGGGGTIGQGLSNSTWLSGLGSLGQAASRMPQSTTTPSFTSEAPAYNVGYFTGTPTAAYQAPSLRAVA